jgi:hypothetical protein
MSMIDDIKRDREAGTPGNWKHYTKGRLERIEAPGRVYEKGGSTCVAGIHKIGSKGGAGAGCFLANAARIARVPGMEAALLDAYELARQVALMLSDDGCVADDIDTALAVFLAAVGEGQ